MEKTGGESKNAKRMIERPWWQRILYQIWPTIYKFINRVVFFIVSVTRETFRLIFRQVKRS